MAPANRFNQPKFTTSKALVSTDATNEQPMGTATQIRMNDKICAMVIDVPKAGANCSATVPNKARASNKPATKPTIDANCLIEPFISPWMTPTPININMIISITSIYLLKNPPCEGGRGMFRQHCFCQRVLSLLKEHPPTPLHKGEMI